MALLRALVACALAAMAACQGAADPAPTTPAPQPARFLGRSAARAPGTCDSSASRVIQELKGFDTVQLRGVATQNPSGSAPDRPADYVMYGSGQTAILPPASHCKKAANNFTKVDFDEAWSYLSCELMRLFDDASVVSAFDRAIVGLQPVVENADNPPTVYPNPWIGATPVDFHNFFRDYFTFLPEPEGKHGGLEFILKANYLVRGNSAAVYFLNNLKVLSPNSLPADGAEYTTAVFDWLYMWVTARGMFMDSPASLGDVGHWVTYVNSQKQSVDADMSDYEGYDPQDKQGYGYKSFNQFFARTFVDQDKSRPVSQADADMVVTAPGDVEINFIINKLTNETKLPVKGDQFNVRELLNSSRLASRFVGGTAVSNVLMPYAYHNFHAPVTGRLVETVDIPGYFFGIPDGKVWFGSGDTGMSTTDFNTFSGFHRRIYIYETEGYGLVAQVAVGLADVNSICQSVEDILGVPLGSCTGSRCHVQKGQRVGFFLYGGSLNILLFEPGVFSSMNVLMGNRIGSMKKRSA